MPASIKLGTNLNVITLDQQRATLDPAATLADTLTGGKSDMVQVGDQSRHVIGYMKDFLFKPEQARTPVGTLSGGERGRLLLAAALAKPSNLLILDEPTNDLDLETLDLLQEMLGDYPGTILLVSHDRDFLDRVATSTLVAEGERHMGGICRRLFRHAGASAARPGGAGEAENRRAHAPPWPQTAAPAPAKLSFKQQHELKTLTAEIEQIAGRDQKDTRPCWRSPGSIIRTSKNSRRRAMRWRRRRKNWRRLKSAGWNWKFCAKLLKQGSGSFLKKRTKKLLLLGWGVWL